MKNWRSSKPLWKISEPFSSLLHRAKQFLPMSTDDTRDLTLGSVSVLGLRLASHAITFVTGLILARALGASGYGTYIFAITWLAFLLVPTLFGMDYVLLRLVSAYKSQSQWPRLKALLRFTNIVTFVSASTVTLISLFVLGTLDGIDPTVKRTLWIIIPLLPLVVFTRTWQAALRGLQYIVQGQLPATIVQPVLLLAAISCGLLLVGKPSTPVELAVIHSAAVGVAFLVAAGLLSRARPKELRGVTPSYETRSWMSITPPLVFIGGVQILLNRVDILMLGGLGTTSDVGTYAVASRIAEAVMFMTDATVLAGSPMVAKLYAIGDRKELQRVVSTVARLNVGFGIPIFLVLFLGSPWILGLFGDEFVAGQNALRVLIIAHLVTAAAGLEAPTLYMTGHQRDVAIVMTASAAINVALNAALIPLYGVLGAAIATGTSLVIFRLVIVAVIYHRIGIISTVHDFGKFKK